MDQKFLNIVFGCLLHDLGKITARSGFKPAGVDSGDDTIEGWTSWRQHGPNGAYALQEWIETRDLELVEKAELSNKVDDYKDIIDAIKYHMKRNRHTYYKLTHKQFADDDIVWIVDVADNIAAGADRRSDGETIDADDAKAEADERTTGEQSAENNNTQYQNQFVKSLTLRDVFDVFGERHTERYYNAQMLNDNFELGFPSDKSDSFLVDRYKPICEKIKTFVQALDFKQKSNIDSLLNLLEATCSFVPSSTNKKEVADISLYDHLKLTASFGSAIYHYFLEHNITNYHNATHNKEQFYSEKMFRLVSFDISGIQDFIYTITDAKASRQLRARSFYLELMTEHLVDDLLEKAELTRANLLYAGGGHAYLILPNTKNAKKAILDFEKETNEFLLETFDISLYIATGDMEFCVDDLDDPKKYRELYRQVSKQISDKKLHRYSGEQILKLNNKTHENARECKVCRRVSKETKGNKCSLCSALEKFSDYILEKKDEKNKVCGYYIVSDEKTDLPVGKDKYLNFSHHFDTIEKIKNALYEADKQANDSKYLKVYTKNKFATGEFIGTKMLVGDYCSIKNGRSLAYDEMAEGAEGINRIAVLRLDVDDLGAGFMSGFCSQAPDGRQDGAYNTMSRTATFSRNLSLFFKYHLNYILRNPQRESAFVDLTYRSPQEMQKLKDEFNGRKIQVIYSGGDDVFLIGSWDEVIEFACELRGEFVRYTNGKLTMSAGIGLFPGKYPISVMARQTGELEEAAKSYCHISECFCDQCQQKSRKSEGDDTGADDRSKDAICLFDNKYTFSWDEFLRNVIGSEKTNGKYFAIKEFFKYSNQDKFGKAFIYKLLGLIRSADEEKKAISSKAKTISMAHWVYFLTRMEPKPESENYNSFNKFKEKLNGWIFEEKDRKELECALELYVYTIRDQEIKE